jgi:hypothetical protein
MRFRKSRRAIQRALSEINPLPALTAGVRTIELVGKYLFALPALRTITAKRF